MRHSSIILSAALASQLLACATEADDPVDDVTRSEQVLDRGIDTKIGGEMTVSSYLHASHAQLCDIAFSCEATFPTSAIQSFSDGWGESARDCYASPLPDDPQVVDERVRAGALRFDASAARACLSGTEIHSCNAFWSGAVDVPSACDSALVGTVAEGGACVLGIECAGGSSYCDSGTHVCTIVARR